MFRLLILIISSFRFKCSFFWEASGRRIAEEDKNIVLSLVAESRENGCRMKVACRDLGVDFKTFSRWQYSVVDNRYGPKSEPKNKLFKEEREEIIKISVLPPQRSFF